MIAWTSRVIAWIERMIAWTERVIAVNCVGDRVTLLVHHSGSGR
jgi:hypothetical protein